VSELLLVGVPGIVLLYGGYWLSGAEFHPERYPRILAWTLGGFTLMLGVTTLVQLTLGSGLDRPVFSVLVATGLESVGGLANGVNEARTVARAREAERTEAELRRERDLRERIVETSPVGIVVVDADSTVSFLNRYAAELFGVTEAEIDDLASLIATVEITNPDGSQSEGEVFERVLSTGDRSTTPSDGSPAPTDNTPGCRSTAPLSAIRPAR